MRSTSIALAIVGAALSGCANLPGSLIRGTGLGAREDRPPAFPAPGIEGRYQAVSGVCGWAAVEREASALRSARPGTGIGLSTGAEGGLQLDIASRVGLRHSRRADASERPACASE